RRVNNQLRIGSNIGITPQTHDTWLTSKEKTKLLADENVSGNNIKVVTENAEVYLMGLVPPIEAEQAVEIPRNKSGVEREITALEYH
ncbi:BON domain-containing protein, partial [Pseudoalteromonas citrea]